MMVLYLAKNPEEADVIVGVAGLGGVFCTNGMGKGGGKTLVEPPLRFKMTSDSSALWLLLATTGLEEEEDDDDGGESSLLSVNTSS